MYVGNDPATRLKLNLKQFTSPAAELETISGQIVQSNIKEIPDAIQTLRMRAQVVQEHIERVYQRCESGGILRSEPSNPTTKERSTPSSSVGLVNELNGPIAILENCINLLDRLHELMEI